MNFAVTKSRKLEWCLNRSVASSRVINHLSSDVYLGQKSFLGHRTFNVAASCSLREVLFNIFIL